MRTRRAARALAAAAATLACAAPVAAHGGALRGAARDPVAVPTWLFLLTGGGVVGVSFLLASVVTDRRLVAAVHGWERRLPGVGPGARTAARALGVAALVAVVVAGLFGPAAGARNLAVLLVWVGWWGAYVASTYLVGNTWPALNPFRTLAALAPSLDRTYPERLGAWPSVAGLLALVWLEVTTPLADDPRLLAGAVLGYAAVTVAGAAAFGADRWFGTVDPVARALRYYGRVAPLSRPDDGRGLRLRLPGAALVDRLRVEGRDEVAFVVALLFVTTYDGFVATAPWMRAATFAVVDVGLPPLLAYLGAYLGGYALALGAYLGAARVARRRAATYLAADALAERFAPPLLAIAAGYHLAHNLGTALALGPTLAAVAANPLAPPVAPPRLVVPAWLTGVELSLVLAGHLLAVWVAHAAAYDLFPDRLQAVRSQYGVTAVMIAFTMGSLWIVSEPYVAPPYLGG